MLGLNICTALIAIITGEGRVIITLIFTRPLSSITTMWITALMYAIIMAPAGMLLKEIHISQYRYTVYHKPTDQEHQVLTVTG